MAEGGSGPGVDEGGSGPGVEARGGSGVSETAAMGMGWPLHLRPRWKPVCPRIVAVFWLVAVARLCLGRPLHVTWVASFGQLLIAGKALLTFPLQLIHVHVPAVLGLLAPGYSMPVH